MNVLVTNNYEGGPILWDYKYGKVERIELIDFCTHDMLLDNYPSFPMSFPPEIYEKIFCYTMDLRLETRNFGIAFQLCLIDRRTLRMFYKQIYLENYYRPLYMIKRLGRTFELADSYYEDYILKPNPAMEGMCAVVCYREGSLRHAVVYEPWDFRSDIEVQKLQVDEGDMQNIKVFPHNFHGGTVWIHGDETDGIYEVELLHHPVIVLILCDYSNSLIPSERNVSNNWKQFATFLRRALGHRAGIYMMVKSRLDIDNPFIEVTDMFLRL